MTASDESTNRMLQRLAGNADFKMFLQWLGDEKTAGLEELLNSTNTISVHQLQGSTRLLLDIERAVMHAPQWLAANASLNT